MRRFSARLREADSYENRTTEVSSEKRSLHIYFLEEN